MSAIALKKMSIPVPALAWVDATTPSKTAEGAVDSLDSDGFTIDWTTASGTAPIFGYIAFGSDAVAPSGATGHYYRHLMARRRAV